MSTESYFYTVKKFRTKLNDLADEHDTAAKALERFKGSNGYSAEREKVERTWKDGVSAAQKEAWKDLSAICGRMREAVESKAETLEPPTTEQLNLLTALKMRKSLTLDELKAAVKSLDGCSVALGALEEIAADNGFALRLAKNSTAGLKNAVNSLESNARRICRITRPNSRTAYLESSNPASAVYDGGSALELFAADMDFSSACECVERLSGADYDTLSAAVD